MPKTNTFNKLLNPLHFGIVTFFFSVIASNLLSVDFCYLSRFNF